MNEKMTDEELTKARDVADYFNPDGTNLEHRLLAHIAALAAERDEARQEASDDADSLRQVIAERDALRERVKALEAEIKTAHDELSVETGLRKSMRDELAALSGKRPPRDRMHRAAAEAEVVTLRKQVKALEAELSMARNAVMSVLPGVHFQWSAAGPLLKNLDQQRVDAESRLAAIRQRAGMLEKVLRGVLDNGTRHTVAGINAWNAARAVVAPPVSELDGLQGGWCEPRAETSPAAPLNPDATGAADGLTPELSLVLVAPTTSKAFATVREAFGTIIASADEACRSRAIERHRSALSLLERRVEAMERAIRDSLEACRCTREGPTPELCPFCSGLEAALTDAPRVFTLEEAKAVETRLKDEVPNPGDEYLSGWLDALNTFTQELERLRR